MRGKVLAVVLGWMLAVAGVQAAGLVACPDCEGMVSYRALLCPHCGCPGDAIKEAVALREAELAGPPILPVARVLSDAGPGHALAVADGGKQYLVMDMQVLGGMTSLEISPLTTNAPIAYWSMQVAERDPLVRFETDATNLFFMGVSPLPHDNAETGYWLLPNGLVKQDGGGNALAAVDAQTNLVAMAFGDGGDRFALAGINWIETGPAAFRQQLALIQQAEGASSSGEMTPAIMDQLSGTTWISGHLENRAKKLLEQHKREKP